MRTKEQSEKVAHSCREILALYERWGNPDPEHVRIVTEKLHEAEQEIKLGGTMELKDECFDMGRLHEFLGAYRLKKYAAKLVAALKEACPHERVGWGFHIILDNGKSIGVMMVEPNGIKLGVEIFPMWPSKPYHRIARIYNEPKEA